MAKKEPKLRKYVVNVSTGLTYSGQNWEVLETVYLISSEYLDGLEAKGHLIGSEPQKGAVSDLEWEQPFIADPAED